VAVDPSVRGNKLREFRSEKCVELSKCRSPEVPKCRSQKCRSREVLKSLRSHRSVEVPKVPKCFSVIPSRRTRVNLSPAPGEKQLKEEV
jgi:hypothetical protein